MRILVTGDRGYIGRVLVPYLKNNGFEVLGVDSNLYRGCDLFESPKVDYERIERDIRELTSEDLQGVDCIHHLAALSNDPLGRINPRLTREINLEGTLRLARAAKDAGVNRFIFSSSCSVYGTSEGEVVDESSATKPLTEYAKSKVRAEDRLKELADQSFGPVFLRNATAYGLSPRIRFDIVVNNLAGWGYTTGKVKILSDGTPWRPLVHVRDIAKAFDLSTKADVDLVRNEAFNVGTDDENYQIRDLAEIVGEKVPNAKVTFGDDPAPDSRSYRVSFEKIEKVLGYSCEWNVPRGVVELVEKFEDIELDENVFKSSSFRRLDHIETLIETGELDNSLYWKGNQ